MTSRMRKPSKDPGMAFCSNIMLSLLERKRFHMTDFEYYYRRAASELKGTRGAERDGCRLIAAGYTSNLDKVVKNPVQAVNDLLKEYGRRIPDNKNSGDAGLCPASAGFARKRPNEPGAVLNSPGEFLEAVLYYASRGLGAEFAITPGLSSFLERRFTCENAVGGTAAQSAIAIGAFGYPVLLHETDGSPELLRQLEEANLLLVRNGKPVRCADCNSAASAMPHYIIQLKKEARLSAGKQNIIIPESNRLIFICDSVNPVLPFNEDFLRYVEQNARRFSSYIISGFNVILEESILLQRIAAVISHIQRVKRVNPDIMLYFEDAFYFHTGKKAGLYREVLPCADFLSLNEEELFQLAKLTGSPLKNNNPESVAQGVEHLISYFSPRKGVVLHTKHYSMYIGEECGTDMRRGLAAGNLIAGAKALTGRFGNMKAIDECLEMPLSPDGLAFYRELAQMPTGRHIDIVPSKYIEGPQFTVGLGDSFIGGVQTCFYDAAPS